MWMAALICAVVMSVPFGLSLQSAAAQPSSDGKRPHAAKLIKSLYRQPWPGPLQIGFAPARWLFRFTAPMQALLKLGPAAQDPLLEVIGAKEIRDQVIILLGGVGDERAVASIIDAMKAAESDPVSEQRRRTLLAGNLALTNITVAGVIWHHGGGISVPNCTNDPGTCWATWWTQNGATFRVSTIKQSRRYSNYPNYGIYKNAP